MDDILHHFETKGNHCLLVFTGESNHSRISWREMDFSTIHKDIDTSAGRGSGLILHPHVPQSPKRARATSGPQAGLSVTKHVQGTGIRGKSSRCSQNP